MNFTYTPFWKRRLPHGAMSCGTLGFLAGLVCSLWSPQGLIVVVALAIISGILITKCSVIERSFIFVFAFWQAPILLLSLGDTEPSTTQRISNLAVGALDLIVWVIPLQLVGLGIRLLVDRSPKINHKSEQDVPPNGP